MSQRKTNLRWFMLAACLIAPTNAPLVAAEEQVFSAVVPEGNYRVTIEFGDAKRPSVNTVKAENRRLMLENLSTKPGEFVTRSFLVNVHTPRISAERSVRLDRRELGISRWDDKLSIECGGENPAVRRVEFVPADCVTTIFIAGDSTVADQVEAPWAGWGQMLPRFFKPDRVVVSNHSESGESLSSFLGERRMEKLLATLLRAGDYLFIQFGHNDMKQTDADAGAFKNYSRLLKEYVATARKHGATPVLVTPMHRLSFDAAGKVTNSLGDYPEVIRRVAEEQHVPLVDLNAMSRDYYEAVGPEKIKTAFVDETHSNETAAWEFARFIATAIKAGDLEIAGEVVDDLPPAGYPTTH